MILAHGIAADAVAAEAPAAPGERLLFDLAQPPHAFQAQIQVHAALHDAEERLVGARMRRQAATRPGAGVVHGARHELAGGGVRGALVQLHGDVGADELLDAHVLLGRPVDLAAVVDGLERDPVVGELHGVGEAEHLEAAGVGEHGAVVVHEAVDAPGLGHQLRAGAHGQVVGVREHHLAAELAQLVGGDPLHRGGGAHGHEHGRVEVAVGSGVGERAGVPAGSVACAIE